MMYSKESVIEKLLSLPHVLRVFAPTEEEVSLLFRAEGMVVPGSGMPMRNDALFESMKRAEHLVVLQDDKPFDHVPHHSMTWENQYGKTIAFDVPDDLRFEIEGRDDLVWISDDFAMEPVGPGERAVLVMHPNPVKVVGAENGVRDAIVMYPATPVDDMIRRRYGLEYSAFTATCILSYDIL